MDFTHYFQEAQKSSVLLMPECSLMRTFSLVIACDFSFVCQGYHLSSGCFMLHCCCSLNIHFNLFWLVASGLSMHYSVDVAGRHTLRSFFGGVVNLEVPTAI